MTAPLVILHRRNKAELLSASPAGSWVEIDVDLANGKPVLTHDALTLISPIPETLADYLPKALRRGVGGFVFDCKREGVAAAIEPLLVKHKINDYFYLNEMDVQTDAALAGDPAHKSAVRIWQYRGAREVIRYVEDMKKARQNRPGWVWIDCWQRGLAEDIGKAFIPLNQTDARMLQKLGVRLCLCSPELYAHDYEKKYKAAELEEIYRGVVRYRKKLMQLGIQADAACTKFPWLWTMDIDLLLKAKSLGVSA